MARVVLVVDDDPLVRETLADMLDRLGCHVKTAAGGTEALEAPRADEKIEILMTDLNMPGMNGYELAEKAKRMRQDLQIILVSGRAQSADVAEAVRSR